MKNVVFFCDDILIIFRIGVKVGNLIFWLNCKIINDGCVVMEVRIFDEFLDCVIGKFIWNFFEKVIFLIDVFVFLVEFKFVIVDVRGGVVVGYIDRLFIIGILNYGFNGVGFLDDIFNKIVNNV